MPNQLTNFDFPPKSTPSARIFEKSESRTKEVNKTDEVNTRNQQQSRPRSLQITPSNKVAFNQVQYSDHEHRVNLKVGCNLDRSTQNSSSSTTLVEGEAHLCISSKQQQAEISSKQATQTSDYWSSLTSDTYSEMHHQQQQQQQQQLQQSSVFHSAGQLLALDQDYYLEVEEANRASVLASQQGDKLQQMPLIQQLGDIPSRLFEANAMDQLEDEDYSVPADESCRLERSQVELVQMIGEGQKGYVFLGKLQSRDGHQLTDVAIKTLKYETRQLIEKLLQEAEMMRQLDHPHIIRFVGVCPDSPALIAMELAKFGELKSYLKLNRSLLSRSQLILFAFQISTALSYLESKQFVHRDVAARNVLVCSPNCVKLTDFGLSRNLVHQNQTTITSHFANAFQAPSQQQQDAESHYVSCSPAKLPVRWLAPESLAFRRYSSASDVWMFAVCTWEMFHLGQLRPWPNIRNNQVLMAIEAGKRLARPPDCPTRLYHLLLQCWSYAPAARPKFRELKQSLWSIFLNERAREQLSLERLQRQQLASNALDRQQLQYQKQQHQQHQLQIHRNAADQRRLAWLMSGQPADMSPRRHESPKPEVSRSSRPVSAMSQFDSQTPANQSGYSSATTNTSNLTGQSSNSSPSSTFGSSLARQARLKLANKLFNEQQQLPSKLVTQEPKQHSAELQQLRKQQQVQRIAEEQRDRLCRKPRLQKQRSHGSIAQLDQVSKLYQDQELLPENLKVTSKFTNYDDQMLLAAYSARRARVAATSKRNHGSQQFQQNNSHEESQDDQDDEEATITVPAERLESIWPQRNQTQRHSAQPAYEGLADPEASSISKRKPERLSEAFSGLKVQHRVPAPPGRLIRSTKSLDSNDKPVEDFQRVQQLELEQAEVNKSKELEKQQRIALHRRLLGHIRLAGNQTAPSSPAAQSSPPPPPPPPQASRIQRDEKTNSQRFERKPLQLEMQLPEVELVSSKRHSGSGRQRSQSPRLSALPSRAKVGAESVDQSLQLLASLMEGPRANKQQQQQQQLERPSSQLVHRNKQQTEVAAKLELSENCFPTRQQQQQVPHQWTSASPRLDWARQR